MRATDHTFGFEVGSSRTANSESSPVKTIDFETTFSSRPALNYTCAGGDGTTNVRVWVNSLAWIPASRVWRAEFESSAPDTFFHYKAMGPCRGLPPDETRISTSETDSPVSEDV